MQMLKSYPLYPTLLNLHTLPKWLSACLGSGSVIRHQNCEYSSLISHYGPTGGPWLKTVSVNDLSILVGYESETILCTFISSKANTLLLLLWPISSSFWFRYEVSLAPKAPCVRGMVLGIVTWEAVRSVRSGAQCECLRISWKVLW